MPNPAYDTLIDSIITNLENGVVPWRKPWADGGLGALPLRQDGIPYSGMNLLMLMTVYDMRAYTGPAYFLTFNQLQALGGKVNKGAKAAPAVLYKTKVLEGEAENEDTVLKFIKHYNVFAACETTGLPDHFYSVPEPAELGALDKRVATIINQFPVPVTYDAAYAYYSIGNDSIHMPPRDRFMTAEDHDATLLHEMAHATGAASRLNRFEEKLVGSALALEEAVAEMTSLMVAARLSLPIPDQLFENHKAYIASWAKHFKDKPSELHKAAAKASAACEYILRYSGDGTHSVREEESQLVQ